MKTACTYFVLKAICPYCEHANVVDEDVMEYEDEAQIEDCEKCGEEFGYFHPENENSV